MSVTLKDRFHQYHRYYVSLREFTQKKPVRSFTTLSLSMLTISFFAFFAVKPTLVIIAGLTKEIKDKETSLAKIQKKVASLVQAQEQYSLNQSRFYLLEEALPNIPDFPSLIYPLEKEALLSGVKIRSFSVTKIEIVKKTTAKAKTAGLPGFEFSLSAEGDYQNLKNYLAKIDSLRRLMTIDKIAFTKTKKTRAEASTIVLTLSGTSNFYLKE